MKTKEKVLNLLEENRGNFVSGQDIADELNISRTAIWKAIQNLKDDKFLIDAVPNRGYKLSKKCDILTSFGIKKHLLENLKDIDLIVKKTIDSTNTEAKRMLNESGPRKLIIVSNEQKKGRGRQGKSFESPKDKGIYLSIAIDGENLKLEEFDLVTLKAALAVCKTIEDLGEKAKIKWVNDIYIGSKKVCGILTEVDADFESRTVKSVIVGIGINVKNSSKLKSLNATHLNTEVLRNEIAASIINNFYEFYYAKDNEKLIDEYKKRSMVLGKWISFNRNSRFFEAKVLDINKLGNLVVDIDGREEILFSGEITLLKEKNGYKK